MSEILISEDDESSRSSKDSEDSCKTIIEIEESSERNGDREMGGSIRDVDGLSDDKTGLLTGLIKDIYRGDRAGCFLHSGVIRSNKGTRQEIKIIFNDIIGRGRNCYFKFIIKHADHYHILHDCKWSNGQCRCFGPRFIKFCTRRHSVPNSITTVSEADWENLFNYHFQCERELYYGKIGTSDGSELYDRLKSLQSRQYGEQDRSLTEARGFMETCGNTNQILWPESSRQDSNGDDSEFNSNTKEANNKGRKRKYDIRNQDQEAKDVAELFIDICASPITDGDRTTPWINSKYKFLNDIEYGVKKAKNYLHMKFSKMSLSDFVDFYEDREERNKFNLWSAHSKEVFDDIYFDKDTSLYKCLQLLIYQIKRSGLSSTYEIKDSEYWKYEVMSYLKDLFLFLDNKTGKQNTQYYVSSSCSGKTFFFDMIKDFLLLHGNMSNWNRNSQFPLQMCVDKKVIFWNEPNCEEAALEDLKKVLGGEYYAANIKNRMHTEIRRTPVIITGNQLIFPNKPEWTCRIKYFNWQTAPFLLDNGSKRLHPLTVLELIKMCENYFEEKII